MTDFKSDRLDFRRQTVRRWFFEISLATLTLAAVLLELVPVIPKWIQWAAVTAFGAYILAELALYPRAKAIASSFRVKLLDDALAFSHAYGAGEVRYSDLRVAKVKRRYDEPVEIVLVAKSGQVVRLRGFESMGELYRDLQKKLDREVK